MSSHLWLPFTQMAQFDAPSRTFTRGEGNYLIDAAGHRVFDAVSSIWTTIHGHCHPHITGRIAEQAATLDHATLLGATHPTAEELASKLAALTGLPYAFFSGDGASAVEVALKMALQYWQIRGEPNRTRFVHLIASYHGDTVGAMSISDIDVFRNRFADLTFEAFQFGRAAELARADDVAAIIVEPLIQAAAGIRVVPPAFYDALADHSALLIVDEIATGFGRTGTMFASEQLRVRPDIMCVGKGLTGGTLALSATLATQEIYSAFLGDHGDLKHFFHGHSFAGNPIACSAALASLELFEREDTLAKARNVSRVLAGRLTELRDLPAVSSVRGVGMMHAIEIDPHHVESMGAMSAAWRVCNDLYDAGFFTRPIGNAIQCVPPLSSTSDEIKAFVDALGEILDQ
ncbi:MAG: adenosylmethionine--8-amino-7-oxononanoate transaminase [Candidatus Eremiobacteraeota bacterium]|nr:adenosylmethionine--8-amino-7-oxononanoate transaminase [Candidatus Eremiobacteraeota bacterium]